MGMCLVERNECVHYLHDRRQRSASPWLQPQERGRETGNFTPKQRGCGSCLTFNCVKVLACGGEKSWKISVHFALHCFRILGWQKTTWKGFRVCCKWQNCLFSFLYKVPMGKKRRRWLWSGKWERHQVEREVWLWFVSLLLIMKSEQIAFSHFGCGWDKIDLGAMIVQLKSRVERRIDNSKFYASSRSLPLEKKCHHIARLEI